jgi:hypothetical protein
MLHILYVLDLIEAQIEAGQVSELLQALDVRNQVIVEIKFRQGLAEIGWEVDACYLVLAQT